MRAKKVDANQKSVVDSLRERGFSVAVTSALGKGFPDLIVGKNGFNLMVELKDGNKPPSARKLTPDEVEFHNSWLGKIVVANNVDEILKHFN